MRMSPCEICRNADPATVFSQPSPFSSWRKAPGGVPWAQDVYACNACGSLWRFHFHPKDMYAESAAPIPDHAAPLVRAGTTWATAWAVRAVAADVVQQYIHLYFFERHDLPWRDVAEVAVADAIREGGGEAAFAALRGLLANRPAMHAARVRAAEVGELWARLEPLRPAAGPAGEAWRLLEAQANETIRLLGAAETSLRARAHADAERAGGPGVHVPPAIFYSERTPGPDPLRAGGVDRPGARELLRVALERLAAEPFAYLLPALGTALVMDVLAPASGAGELAGPVFFPMCLMAYAAQAALVSGRWSQPLWKLYVDRFGHIFQLWGVLILALLFSFGIGLLIVAVGPEEWGHRRELDVLAVALVLLPAARLWPVVVMTFVYRGYVYYESVDAGSDVHAVWIGPTLRAAWRISGQRGFFRRVTLPLFAAVGALVAVLYWSGFAWWARAATYLLALPLFVQFADQAIERWRVPTGKAGLDW
jgi:hypothetical protein